MKKKTKISKKSQSNKQRKLNSKYVFISISFVVCGASLVVNPLILSALIRFTPIIAVHETIKFSETLKSSDKGKRFLTILLLSVQLTGPLSSLYRPFYSNGEELFHSYIQSKAQLAFNYNDREQKKESSLRRSFSATQQRLSRYCTTHKRLVREHLPLAALGVVHTVQGVQHYLAEDKITGVLDVVLGGYLLLRSQLSEELQVNKNLLMMGSITVLVLDNSKNFNLVENLTEKIEQQQKIIIAKENYLNYLDLVIKNEAIRDSINKKQDLFLQDDFFLSAQQKSRLIEKQSQKLAQQKPYFVKNGTKEKGISPPGNQKLVKVDEQVLTDEAREKILKQFRDKK